jgi:hypothetical protein
VDPPVVLDPPQGIIMATGASETRHPWGEERGAADPNRFLDRGPVG